MANKAEIIKANIAFMYGRDIDDPKNDPDKRSLVRTATKFVETDMISEFSGEHEFLSPSYPCSVCLPLDPLIYPSYEHALQASKTLDQSIRKDLSEIRDIRELKRAVTRLIALPDEWKEKCLDISRQLLRDKFFRSKDLQAKLMKTGHRSIRFVNSFRDLFWGMNLEQKGQNNYGKIVEEIREAFENGSIEKKWTQDHFQLEPPDRLSLRITCRRENEAPSGAREAIESQVIEHMAVVHIGKSSDNDIRLQTPTASRFHAIFLVDKRLGLQLIDLNSANGTYINSSIEKIPPMTPLALQSGVTEIQFGVSKRRYVVELDLDAESRRREQLYSRLGDPSEGSKDSEAETTAFVGNLSYSCTEEDLSNTFTPCGVIRSIKIPKDQTTKEGRGIAFIIFESVSGLRQALVRDGDLLNGRAMKVKRSEAKGGPPPTAERRDMRPEERNAKEEGKPTYYQDHQRGREGKSDQRSREDGRTREETGAGDNLARRRKRSKSSDPGRDRRREGSPPPPNRSRRRSRS
jgi:predicted NAD-dependent protein-ADP-ribosyltransferase YbiA (DUF1768 family)